MDTAMRPSRFGGSRRKSPCVYKKGMGASKFAVRSSRKKNRFSSSLRSPLMAPSTLLLHSNHSKQKRSPQDYGDLESKKKQAFKSQGSDRDEIKK